MKEPAGDRILPILLSVLIHAAIVGVLVWGAILYRRPRPAPSTLAIEGTLVSSAPAAPPAPPAPPPAPPAAAGGGGRATGTRRGGAAPQAAGTRAATGAAAAGESACRRCRR